MIFSLLITAGSAAYLYFALKEKSTLVVPLQPLPPTPDPAVASSSSDSVSSSSPTVSGVSTSSETLTQIALSSPTISKDSKDSKKSKVVLKISKELRIILFKYGNLAKEVSVIGDFNDWIRKPLKKKNNMWQVTLKIPPGTYEYQFVVDGKKENDPKNPAVSESGRSILTVKPAAPKK